MSKLPDINDIRGMGEPLYFTFTTEPKTKILICHAVIFSTFIVADDVKLKLCAPEDDPRMPHFVQYIWNNYLKDMKAKLNAKIAEIESELKNRKESLNQLEAQIKQLGEPQKPV